MKRKDRAWLERLDHHDPTARGFIFGRDDPNQVFHTPDFRLPKNYDYMQRWRLHLSLHRKNDPNDGLTTEEIGVLMNSEDTNRRVTVVIFGNESSYPAQFSKLTKVVKKLQAIGLVYIIEYRGGGIIGPDGLPLGLKGCEWAWTPIGLKWVRVRLGLEDNDFRNNLVLHPSVTDPDHYG